MRVHEPMLCVYIYIYIYIYTYTYIYIYPYYTLAFGLKGFLYRYFTAKVQSSQHPENIIMRFFNKTPGISCRSEAAMKR